MQGLYKINQVIFMLLALLLASCQSLPESVSLNTGAYGKSDLKEISAKQVTLNKDEYLDLIVDSRGYDGETIKIEFSINHSDVISEGIATDTNRYAFHRRGFNLRPGRNTVQILAPENIETQMLRLINSSKVPLKFKLHSVDFTKLVTEPFSVYQKNEDAELNTLSALNISQLTENSDEISLLIKLWGLSKYSEQPFLKRVDGQNIDNQLLSIITQWLGYSGTLSSYVNELLMPVTDEATARAGEQPIELTRPLIWLQSPLLADARNNIERHIKKYRLGGAFVSFHYFAIPTNEHRYAFSTNIEFNLVMLARAWATLNYLSPNVALAPERFDNFLSLIIRDDSFLSDQYSIKTALEQLGGAFQDGHIALIGGYDRKRFCSLPINAKYLSDQLFVAGIRDIDAVPSWLDTGADIAAINGQVVDKDYMQTFRLPASNVQASTDFNALRSVFRVPCNSPVEIDFIANGVHYQHSFMPQIDAEYDYYANTASRTKKPELPENVSFIYSVRESSQAELDQAFAKPYVIIDIRQYPSLSNYFELPKRILGTHKYGYDLLLLHREQLGKLIPAFYSDSVFSSDLQPYTGKVFVLVNHKAGSRAEALILTLQQSEQVTVVGSTTQGLGATASYLPLWQNVKFRFTAEGMTDLSGEWLHQRGVIVDEFIQQTKAEYLTGTDVELERALELIGLQD